MSTSRLNVIFRTDKNKHLFVTEENLYTSVFGVNPVPITLVMDYTNLAPFIAMNSYSFTDIPTLRRFPKIELCYLSASSVCVGIGARWISELQVTCKMQMNKGASCDPSVWASLNWIFSSFLRQFLRACSFYGHTFKNILCWWSQRKTLWNSMGKI